MIAMRLLGIALALALEPAWVPPAAAQEQPAGERFVVPFAPATGQPFRYRLTRTNVGDGAPPPAEIVMTLTFVEAATGYELTIATESVTVEGYTYTTTDPRLYELQNSQDVTWLLAPITFELGRGGQIVRVKHWDDFRANLRLLPQIALEGATDPRLRQAIRASMAAPDPLANATAEGAAAVVQPLWRMILGYGGLEVTAGLPREWSNTRRLLNGEATVTYSDSVVFERLPDGGYGNRYQRIENPEGFIEAIELAERSDDEALKREAANLKRNPTWLFDVMTTITTTLALDSHGVVRSGEQVTSWKPRRSEARTTTVTIKRVD